MLMYYYCPAVKIAQPSWIFAFRTKRKKIPTENHHAHLCNIPLEHTGEEMVRKFLNACNDYTNKTTN